MGAEKSGCIWENEKKKWYFCEECIRITVLASLQAMFLDNIIRALSIIKYIYKITKLKAVYIYDYIENNKWLFQIHHKENRT